MAGAKDRKRLLQNSAEEIGRILSERGYASKINGKRAIQIYKVGTIPDAFGDFPKTWVGALFWDPKKGWRLDLAQPILYTNYDLETAIIEIDSAQEASKAVDEAWAEFDAKRNDTNWMKYQGVMAAHQTKTLRKS